jgi:phage terminase small subunit
MTLRQQHFMRLILADPGNNATAAARAAGYAWPNKQGPRLMATVGVGDVIRAQIARQLEEYRQHRHREREAARACG